MTKEDKRRPRIGLALAGGGPGGAVYEVGALRALDDALEGLAFSALDMYVGVSAGSFLAACLANGMTSGQLSRASIQQDASVPFAPGIFFRPDVKEFVRRGLGTPRLAFEALADFLGNPREQSVVSSFARLSRALPIGLFDNEPLREYLHQALKLPGRTDDFRRLEARLAIVATDLDSGDAVCFGDPGLDQVPISTAVQASTALPGLYSPVLIGDRHYVDGVLNKTLHASVALDAGTRLLFCLNPIVPVDTEDSVRAGLMRRGKLVDRGLPGVLSQTFRTLVHSRMSAGIASYKPRYPDQDIVLIEPPRDDYRMFFTNIFSFANRKVICEHAYDSTMRQLGERRDELAPILDRHGVRLCNEVLDDPDRSFGASIGLGKPPREPASPLARRLDLALDRLQTLLDES